MSGGFDWFPDWSQEIVLVVASGPSAKSAGLDAAKGKAKALAVNNSWQLVPWADALYAADSQWWSEFRGAKEFKGLRVSQSDEAAKRYGGISNVSLARVGQIVRSPRGTLGAGSDDRGTGANSGFQALNLAVQFGAKRIVLVGYDMTAAHGFHWHGRHPDGMNNPTEAGLARWGRVIDRNAGYLKKIGVDVINASLVSALQNFPKMTLEQAIEKHRTASCD